MCTIDFATMSVDWMVHFFHLLCYVVGEIDEVSGQATIVEPIRITRDTDGNTMERIANETDDTMACLLKYGNGGTGTVFGSWAKRGIGVSLTPVFYSSNSCIKGE